jgi:hypothetical protein
MWTTLASMTSCGTTRIVGETQIDPVRPRGRATRSDTRATKSADEDWGDPCLGPPPLISRGPRRLYVLAPLGRRGASCLARVAGTARAKIEEIVVEGDIVSSASRSVR